MGLKGRVDVGLGGDLAWNRAALSWVGAGRRGRAVIAKVLMSFGSFIEIGELAPSRKVYGQLSPSLFFRSFRSRRPRARGPNRAGVPGLAEGLLNRKLFGTILGRIWALPLPNA